MLSWRVRVALWLAGATAGWAVTVAVRAEPAAQAAAAAAGLAVACLAEAPLCYRRVRPAGAAPRPSPAKIAAIRAEADRRLRRWETEAVPSPGGWRPPDGSLPTWNWLPPDGIVPRTDRVPAWVRLWYRTPFADRYAHAWMWRHGGWDVLPPSAT